MTAGAHTDARVQTRALLLGVELSDGTSCELIASGPLNAETFAELKTYLYAFEAVLEKRAAKARDAARKAESGEPMP